MTAMPRYSPTADEVFVRESRLLKATETAAYARLVWHLKTDGPIPDDDDRLARIAGLPLYRWRKARPQVEQLFTLLDGSWRHHEVDRATSWVDQHCAQKAAAYRRNSPQPVHQHCQKSQQNQQPAAENGKPIEPKEGSIGSARETRTPRPSAPDPISTIDHKKRRAAEPPTARPRRHSRHPSTPIDPAWTPTPADIRFAQQRGYDDLWIERQADLFGNHHLARGSRFADWAAAWCCWVDRAQQFRRANRHGTHEERIACETRERRAIFARSLGRRGAVG
jgi:uncharacterized protein YdaU (DUF1376 family)